MPRTWLSSGTRSTRSGYSGDTRHQLWRACGLDRSLVQAKNWTYPLMRSTKMSRMGASKGSASLGSSHVLYGDVCLIPLSYLGIKSPQFGCQLSLGSNKIWSRWNLNPPAWIGNITRKQCLPRQTRLSTDPTTMPAARRYAGVFTRSSAATWTPITPVCPPQKTAMSRKWPGKKTSTHPLGA